MIQFNMYGIGIEKFEMYVTKCRFTVRKKLARGVLRGLEVFWESQ
uniref:Uncharacterized protein n=1 Tax=Lepeophtheirus salmonis TaxID=72036 RepID=A0A0K2VHA9_LEPSM